MKRLNKIETAINKAYIAALAVTAPKLAPKVKIVVQQKRHSGAPLYYVALKSSANGLGLLSTEANGYLSANAAANILGILSWGFSHAKIEFIGGGKKQKLPIV